MNAVPSNLGAIRLAGVVGRGRRSTVYRAFDGDRELALKVSATDLATEAGVLRRLGHPGVVGLRAEGGNWLAMEFAAGGALSEWTGRAIGEELAAAWLRGAAAALAHVHAQGWVHRDVKPANLLLRAGGELVLADFGEAVPAGHVPPASGLVIGSPAYAAPEQLQGAPAAPAADVYSLGVLLHEWLTGRPPFAAVTLQEALAQHLLAPVPRLPAALARWQALLDAMLAKRAEERPCAATVPNGIPK